MTEQQRSRLESIIEEGYTFELGHYISRGFELFQKGAGNFIGFAFVAGIILVIAGLIPFIGSLLSNLILTPALFVGGYLAAHKLNLGERLEFGTFFKGFDFIGPLATAALVTNLIVLVSMIPIFIVWYSSGLMTWFSELLVNPMVINETPEFPIWSLVLLAPTVYLSIAYAWAYHFIAFYGMNFWEAMESSRRLISKQWGMFFLFFLVMMLIVVAGFLLFFVGALVAIPVLMCANYAAFAEVTDLLREEAPDIADHLVA